MVHKSRLGALVIDCETDDLDRETAFWSAALGYAAEPRDPDDDVYRKITAPRNDVQIIMQKVDHPSRVHLDIEADDLEAEVARLKRLGAHEIKRVRTWCVMEAPSGHRFCVVGPQRSDFQQAATEWPD